MDIDSRDIAYRILLEIEKDGGFMGDALETALRRNQFSDKKERAFLTRITEGVTERRLTLDFLIKKFSKTPFAKLKPEILTLLRMGIYQIVYMDSVPDRAAVSETVRLTEKHKLKNLTGFVNAVLRAVITAGEENRLKGMIGSSKTVRYSTPEWICSFLTKTYGKEQADRMLSSQFEDRPLTIRVNTSKIQTDELCKLFSDAGVKTEKGSYSEHSLHVSGYDHVRRLPGYDKGYFSVQDESSTMAIERLYQLGAADSKGHLKVLDLCAAPGGKSLYMAELLGKRGNITSRDISEDKTDLIRENAERLGLTNVTIEERDAVSLDGDWIGRADIVIADVPCSGLGVMGHKNDIKYHVSPEGMQELAEQASVIIRNAAMYVKLGGVLMYSTCTVNPGENGDVVRKYMETGGTDEGFSVIEEKTFLQGVDDCDGFYYAVLKKKADISSMYPEELEQYLTGLGYPKFRSAQVFSWLHEKYVGSAEDMTNLPKDMREKLDKEMFHVEEETRQESKIDGTIKFLFRMEDGQMIETVFMKYHHGNSICISSQCGCAMGCKFCASTIGGCIRNLTASEMLGQIYAAMRITGERISNVVVMGTGEPMQNYDNLIRFIRLLTNEKGYNLSVRNITVSTCGIVPKIDKLAKEGLPITLALSLHAPTDELRRTLMPVANRYSLKETLEACERYFDKTGRRLTAEYSLMHGINDTPECGETLGTLLKGRGFHVNLIPVNPVNETDFKPGTASDIQAFKKILEKYGINVTIRRGLGADIDAACGQLRRRRETNS